MMDFLYNGRQYFISSVDDERLVFVEIGQCMATINCAIAENHLHGRKIIQSVKSDLVGSRNFKKIV